MKACVLFVVGLVLSAAGLPAQDRPVLVVQPVTLATGVEIPYDLKSLQSQLLAEFRVMLGRDFEIAAEMPSDSPGTSYTLECEITEWRAGNVAKRLLIGMGSGREASDIQYRVMDGSGKKVLERKDTIRTNFYSQTGSTGTLAHPIAQKIADRIKNARLK
jgi:hypothetical protein